MKWRVLISGKTNPYYNMAIDEAIYHLIAQGESPPTIRFYDWKPSSFSYGYNQDIKKELDLEKVKKSPYSYVRRPTGGRLVLHDNEVTYAVMAPIAEEMSGPLSVAYLRIANALKKGFDNMGIKVDLSGHSLSRSEQRRNNNPCFSSSSLYELTYERKKIVGSAQVRNNYAFLQHGSILVSNNQAVVADYLPGINSEEKMRVKTFLTKRTTTINSILGRSMSYEAVVANLEQGFYGQWKEDSFYTETNFTEKERLLSDSLFYGKYAQIQWNQNKQFDKKVLTHNQA